MMSEKEIFDFNILEGRVFAGKPNGEAIAEAFDIRNDSIGKILIPNDTKLITSSFFYGAFGHCLYYRGSSEEFFKAFEVYGTADILNRIHSFVDSFYVLEKTLVEQTFTASKKVKNKRNIEKILTHATTEMGELAQEVQIAMGDSYKEAGPDGVVGEAVDLILCALDLIKIHEPDITEEDLMLFAREKIHKWIEKDGN